MSHKGYIQAMKGPIPPMDTTVRNLDPEAYRRLKAWAAARGVTIGTALSEIIVDRIPKTQPRLRSFGDLPSEDFGPGTETLSEDVDDILYGG